MYIKAMFCSNKLVKRPLQLSLKFLTFFLVREIREMRDISLAPFFYSSNQPIFNLTDLGENMYRYLTVSTTFV
jgi:hypothetical protein